MTKVETAKAAVAACEKRISEIVQERDYQAGLHFEELKKELDRQRTRAYELRSALREAEAGARGPSSPVIDSGIQQIWSEYQRRTQLIETISVLERGRLGVGGGEGFVDTNARKINSQLKELLALIAELKELK